ncbi:hypothetical protein RM780_10945 [Streptomyces sp. DSM 44917]|uniref:Uncharacterized protein n=1 Tax=Streptomyces boetiae TaxID=3075541 RepID=A0ABU2L7C6_9ACTN|nr:hypothetical protein [Streptomyces sp. DSM 44917]MDT0307479.1 hypothetical protein [Streptomyces sp. DSM 44917]
MAENLWVAGFDHPGAGWHQLDVRAEDGPERVAQEIADRGGDLNHLYAEAVLPELKLIRQGAVERGAAPVVVFVPDVPAESRPLVPITAFVAPWGGPPPDGGPASVAALARVPRDYRLREPLIGEIDLPAGPALRVHELVREEPTEDGRRLLMEYVSYYVFPPGLTDGPVEMTVSWSSPAIGAEMAGTADEIAASLTVSPAAETLPAEALFGKAGAE